MDKRNDPHAWIRCRAIAESPFSASNQLEAEKQTLQIEIEMDFCLSSNSNHRELGCAFACLFVSILAIGQQTLLGDNDESKDCLESAYD